MCAVGSEPANVWVHLDYFYGHNEEVVPWVAQKAKAKVSLAQNFLDFEHFTLYPLLHRLSLSVHTMRLLVSNMLSSKILLKPIRLPSHRSRRNQPPLLQQRTQQE